MSKRDKTHHKTAENGREKSQTAIRSGTPQYDEIANRAYQLWERRGCPIGTPEEDWIRAEEELRGRQQEDLAMSGSASF
jgi:hypothetical protein